MDKWLYGHEEQDRDRGILSPADREFLTTGGENLSSDSARQNARHRIRNRIRNAIIDFDLIVRLLDEEDQRLVFGEEGEWEPSFISGQKAMIEFLYTTLKDSDTPVDFETILRSGVHDGELQQHDEPVFINVDFNVETDVQFDIEASRRRFEEGESLNVAEIGALLATGEIDEDELEDLAELAQEKGVVESSIAPLQSHYVESEMENSKPPGEKGKFPVNTEGNLRNYFARGESLMLTNAYAETHIPPSSKGTDDSEDSDADSSESEEEADG